MRKYSLVSLLPFAVGLPGQDLADVFAKVSPAVVTVQVVVSTFDGPSRDKPKARVGSGVLIDEGTILTAWHLVDLAHVVAVEFAEGSRLLATVDATAPAADLALLCIEGELPDGVKPGELGNSDGVRVGNQVFAVGAPLGMPRTLTAGHVSARRRHERFLGSMRHVEHLQTDAAINPGNSGGPLFDSHGRVIGIICHIANHAKGAEGIGFAVTSNAARDLLIAHRASWLGFDGVQLPNALARALNVPGGRVGVLVTRVAQSTPASAAGLRAGQIPVAVEGERILLGGDIVLEILGHSLETDGQSKAARAAAAALKPGDKVEFTVLRAGKVERLSARLRRSP